MPKIEAPAKAAAKESGEKKERTSKQREELISQITKFMRKGKVYTSREVVEGLGRTPGNTEGQPVVNALKAMLEAGTVKQAPAEEGKRGQRWVR